MGEANISLSLGCIGGEVLVPGSREGNRICGGGKGPTSLPNMNATEKSKPVELTERRQILH